MARSHEIPRERASPKDERTFAPPLPAPLPAATIDRGVAPRFVALVAQALGCRHCWIRLVGSDGDVLTDDAFDALHDDGAPWSDLPRAPFDDERIAFRSSSASMHLPVELADGTAGEVVVAGGHAFGAADVASLDQLVRSYVATYDDTAWREVRRLRAEVKEMRRQATSIKERDRLARELHDDVGHAITTAIFGLDSKTEAFRTGSAEHQAMVAAREVLVDCADHVQEFAFHIRPRVLADLGLVPAVRGLARWVRETTSMPVEVVVAGDVRRLGEETELTAFRVVQDALTNALKLARATLIRISVAYTPFGLEVEVRDDGKGFAAGRAGRATVERGVSGQGLAGMRERVQLAGGVLEVDSEGGVGTAIWTRLPFLEATPC